MTCQDTDFDRLIAGQISLPFFHLVRSAQKKVGPIPSPESPRTQQQELTSAGEEEYRNLLLVFSYPLCGLFFIPRGEEKGGSTQESFCVPPKKHTTGKLAIFWHKKERRRRRLNLLNLTSFWAGRNVPTTHPKNIELDHRRGVNFISSSFTNPKKEAWWCCPKKKIESHAHVFPQKEKDSFFKKRYSSRYESILFFTRRNTIWPKGHFRFLPPLIFHADSRAQRGKRTKRRREIELILFPFLFFWLGAVPSLIRRIVFGQSKKQNHQFRNTVTFLEKKMKLHFFPWWKQKWHLLDIGETRKT